MRFTLHKKCLYSELFWSRVILFTQCHPFIYFYNIPVTQTNVQKHIWLYLDEKLNCITHVKQKLISKVFKGIGLLRNLSDKFPRQTLVTIYKAFIRLRLDNGDILYDKPLTEAFCNKTEKVQYDAALAIIDAIKGTSRNKLYPEVGT